MINLWKQFDSTLHKSNSKKWKMSANWVSETMGWNVGQFFSQFLCLGFVVCRKQFCGWRMLHHNSSQFINISSVIGLYYWQTIIFAFESFSYDIGHTTRIAKRYSLSLVLSQTWEFFLKFFSFLWIRIASASHKWNVIHISASFIVHTTHCPQYRRIVSIVQLSRICFLIFSSEYFVRMSHRIECTLCHRITLKKGKSVDGLIIELIEMENGCISFVRTPRHDP